MFPRQVLVENQSPVMIRHLSYSGLNQQLNLLYHFVSQFLPRKVIRSLVGCTFLNGGCRGCWRPIELHSKLPTCALIIATFSAYFPLKVILWWEKYKDSSSTLKEDSLSELYSPTQSGYFVLLEVGEGQMLLFRYLWRVMHKSNLGSGKATTFLAKNF